MKKTCFAFWIASALLAAASPISAQTQPATQQQAVGTMVPELSDAQLQQWITKLNAYTSLANSSLGAMSSWSRYTSWVNIKTGLTGKERLVYGLYSISDSVVKTDVPKAREAVNLEPKIPSLDSMVVKLADALDKLDPIAKEAYAYYNRKDYTDDKFAKGREMHPKLVEAFQAVEASRTVFDKELTAIKEQVDNQSLNFVEKTEGKKYHWHSKRILMESRKAIEALQKVDSKKDLPAFSEAIKAYAEAVRQFDDYIAAMSETEKPRGMSLKSEPDSLLSYLREAREYLEKGNATWFNNHSRSAVSTYNRMITFSR